MKKGPGQFKMSNNFDTSVCCNPSRVAKQDGKMSESEVAGGNHQKKARNMQAIAKHEGLVDTDGPNELAYDGRTRKGQELDSESTTTTSHHSHIMTDSNQVGTVDVDAIASVMNTRTFKTWSALPIDDDSVTEQKLIEPICLGSKNSKKQAMKTKQSREDKKGVERNQVFPGRFI